MPFPTPLIEKTLATHVEACRPPVEIRTQLDIGYKINKQVVELFERRPQWNDPSVYHEHAYAKIRYIKSSQLFKLYWQRASLKWKLYEPFPESSHLQKLLEVIKEDRYGCFRG